MHRKEALARLNPIVPMIRTVVNEKGKINKLITKK